MAWWHWHFQFQTKKYFVKFHVVMQEVPRKCKVDWKWHWQGLEAFSSYDLLILLVHFNQLPCLYILFLSLIFCQGLHLALKINFASSRGKDERCQWYIVTLVVLHCPLVISISWSFTRSPPGGAGDGPSRKPIITHTRRNLTRSDFQEVIMLYDLSCQNVSANSLCRPKNLASPNSRCEVRVLLARAEPSHCLAGKNSHSRHDVSDTAWSPLVLAIYIGGPDLCYAWHFLETAPWISHIFTNKNIKQKILFTYLSPALCLTFWQGLHSAAGVYWIGSVWYPGRQGKPATPQTALIKSQYSAWLPLVHCRCVQFTLVSLMDHGRLGL